MGSVEIVEVFPLLELLVEQAGVVDDDTVEHSVELFAVDSVGSLHLAVQPGSGRLDIHVPDATIQDVPVERSLELGPVVRLDGLDLEGKLLEDVVEELDRGLLVVPGVDPEHPEAGAIVDGRVLVVLLSRPGQGLDELHVDLDPVTRERLLVTLPAVLVPFVALRGG